MNPRYSRPEMAEIWSDSYRYNLWLQIEWLIAESQVKLGAIPEKALERIKRRAGFNEESIHRREEQISDEVMAFVEEVCSHLKDDTKFFHRGVASSDITDTALAVQLTRSGILLLHDLNILLGNLERRILASKDIVMVGRTNGLHAEPISLGFKLAVWFSELDRHRERMLSAIESIRVGKVSGSVGTYAYVNPEIEGHVCLELGLRSAAISTQVIQRDRHAHFVTSLALLASTLEKIAIEVRNLQRTEIAEVEEPFDAAKTGTNAMPHKRNPVMSEDISGLARLVRSHAIAAMENISLWHERDSSHVSVEEYILPHSCITLDYMLDRMNAIIKDLRIMPENMMKNLALSHGLVFSGRVMVALMEKGLDRQTAHSLVQTAAMKAQEGEGDFKTLLIQNHDISKMMSKDDIEACFDFDVYLKNLPTIYKRLGL